MQDLKPERNTWNLEYVAVPRIELAGGYATNRELASSPAQNEAFTTRTVDAAEALFLGKGQQLTGIPRCLSLQGVGLEAF